MEYIKHVGRYVSSSRNAAYEARGSADNALEAAQPYEERKIAKETDGPATKVTLSQYINGGFIRLKVHEHDLAN